MVNIKHCKKLPPVKYDVNPKFGTIFAPHYLKMHLKAGPNEVFEAEILPLEDEPFSPTTCVLHYGQSIFEGMKAFKQADGGAGIFRADLHAERFLKSAQKMMMAELPTKVFVECLKDYVKFVADNVPSEPDHSLYLRPLLIAKDPMIKMGPSVSYTFYIMSSIAGSYFGSSGEIKPARLMVNKEFVRAYPGGLGEVKTAANYAAGLGPQRLAAQKECDQVLYLDATKREFVDELGGMNFFVVKGKDLITPQLNGCILNGVTRRSILEMAPSLGLNPIEAPISFPELRREIEDGTVDETFACGTAAVVHPIGEYLVGEKITDDFELVKMSKKPETAMRILKRLQAIQRGQEQAPGDWVLKV